MIASTRTALATVRGPLAVLAFVSFISSASLLLAGLVLLALPAERNARDAREAAPDHVNADGARAALAR